MARTFQPAHAPDDGDVVFTVSTTGIPGDDVNSTALGVVASELAWDAVLSSFGVDAVVPLPE
jgi:L-aminopeptidase/D-esterase-like protein